MLMLHLLYNYCCVIIDLSYKTKRCNMYIQEVLQYMIKTNLMALQHLDIEQLHLVVVIDDLPE
jgi:hypothetical protein